MVRGGLIFIFMVFCLLLPGFTEQSVPFRVIVNAENDQASLSRDELSRIFLKKTQRWTSLDEKIKPIDLHEQAEIRKAFSDMVIEKKVSTVKAYWQKQIFSGRGVPPPEKATDKQVLEYVHENIGAIGYVSTSISLDGYNVKNITIVDE